MFDQKIVLTLKLSDCPRDLPLNDPRMTRLTPHNPFKHEILEKYKSASLGFNKKGVSLASLTNKADKIADTRTFAKSRTGDARVFGSVIRACRLTSSLSLIVPRRTDRVLLPKQGFRAACKDNRG